VEGEEINMLRFADDIAIVVRCEADLQKSLKIIEKLFQEYIIKINKKKTKALVCWREKTMTDVRQKEER
jgi:ribosome-interacting GTPase 1